MTDEIEVDGGTFYYDGSYAPTAWQRRRHWLPRYDRESSRFGSKRWVWRGYMFRRYRVGRWEAGVPGLGVGGGSPLAAYRRLRALLRDDPRYRHLTPTTPLPPRHRGFGEREDKT